MEQYTFRDKAWHLKYEHTLVDQYSGAKTTYYFLGLSLFVAQYKRGSQWRVDCLYRALNHQVFRQEGEFSVVAGSKHHNTHLVKSEECNTFNISFKVC